MASPIDDLLQVAYDYGVAMGKIDGVKYPNAQAWSAAGQPFKSDATGTYENYIVKQPTWDTFGETRIPDVGAWIKPPFAEQPPESTTPTTGIYDSYQEAQAAATATGTSNYVPVPIRSGDNEGKWILSFNPQEPSGVTEPITRVDAQGNTWISGNGGKTWQMQEPIPAEKSDVTEPMTTVDAQGNTWISGNGGKTWQMQEPIPAEKSATKPTGLWDKREEAQAAAGTSGYTPYQLTNGYWGLQEPRPTETPATKPTGLWDTREEAQAAAGSSGYTPYQLTNGYWGLQEPNLAVPMTEYQRQQLELEKKAAQPRVYAPPGGTVTPRSNLPSIKDIEAYLLTGGAYNPLYDINKDKAINMADVTARELQPMDEVIPIDVGGGTTTFTDAQGNVYQWDSNTGRYVVAGYDATRDTSRQMTDYQKQTLALERQQMSQNSASASGAAAARSAELAWQQQQAQKELDLRKQEHLADLAAHPINWLQYSSEAGIAPMIQPWMLPLQPGQYGLGGGIQPYSTPQAIAPTPQGNTPYNAYNQPSRSNLAMERIQQQYRPQPQPAPALGNWQIGQGIPGYTATNMKGMPALLNPSSQLFARMAPSMQQQYAGYQQAQTGATPEDTAWLLQNQAAPGGRWPGLRYSRG